MSKGTKREQCNYRWSDGLTCPATRTNHKCARTKLHSGKHRCADKYKTEMRV